MRSRAPIALLAILWPSFALAAEDVSFHPVWALPFVGILASIALFPLLAHHFWERHQGKIAAAWGVAVALPLLIWQGPIFAADALLHAAVLDYIPFILVLLALFTVAGGIVVRGSLRGSPLTNTVLLAIGTVLASIIGTTGASIVMIRPVLRANDDRKHRVHVVVFFIFLVSNIGGSLTPLGDPPLFLGFLRGVDFFWTTQHLLAPMLFASSILLAIFFVLDTIIYRREGHLPFDATPEAPIRVSGWPNILLIGVIIGGILMSAVVDLGTVTLLHTTVTVAGLLRDFLLVGVVAASIFITPKSDLKANGFSWAPIQEVAKLFAGIFVTLIPVLAMLRAGRDGPFAPLVAMVSSADGSPNNLAYFWLTGILSSALDNAPTYIVFFELAGGDAAHLMTAGAVTLGAISAGAVFMGANTYIGNAPNFMVYAIARNAGQRMPSFFGYMRWSGIILLPIFVLVSLIFYR
jgi:Na+/H+ antiporter NhaD/arsenite permease-like protein